MNNIFFPVISLKCTISVLEFNIAIKILYNTKLKYKIWPREYYLKTPIDDSLINLTILTIGFEDLSIGRISGNNMKNV